MSRSSHVLCRRCRVRTAHRHTSHQLCWACWRQEHAQRKSRLIYQSHMSDGRDGVGRRTSTSRPTPSSRIPAAIGPRQVVEEVSRAAGSHLVLCAPRKSSVELRPALAGKLESPRSIGNDKWLTFQRASLYAAPSRQLHLSPADGDVRWQPGNGN
jgi:hypothetical protein